MHRYCPPFAVALFFTYLCAAGAWTHDMSKWLDLGNGECRPISCPGGCGHPWAERSKSVCSLNDCLTFALYDSTEPITAGFRRIYRKAFLWSSQDSTIGYYVQLPRESRRVWKNTYSIDEAATLCSNSSTCKGFRCYASSGTCSAFYTSSSVPCADQPWEYNGMLCHHSGTDFEKDSSITASALRPLVAVYYAASGGSNPCGSCTAYDQANSAAPARAFGVGPYTPHGQCYRPVDISAPAASEDSSIAVSMTDANGQALKAMKVDTRVAMYGPFGVVQTGFTFRNEQTRQIEGRFRYVLPYGATVQRLAMKIRGHWMEGEVVEKSKARKIWNELLLQRRDPALLEQEQGNVYSMKIFPINAEADVELILTYSVLAPMHSGVRTLVIPMRGLPAVVILRTMAVAKLAAGEVVTTARGPRGDLPNISSDNDTMAFQEETEGVPIDDIVVQVTTENSSEYVHSMRAGKYTITWRMLETAVGSTSPRAHGGSWRVYIDTSASTADTFVARTVMIKAFFDLMSEKASASDCAVWAFDMNVVPLVSQTSDLSGISERVNRSLYQRLPLGMTRIDQVLAHVVANPANLQSNGDYVVLISDAIATLGPKGAASGGSLDGVQQSTRLYVLNLGTKIDREVATEIAGLGGGRVVETPATAKMDAATSRMSKAWDELLAPIGTTGVLESLSSSTSMYPARFYDLKPGSEVIYFAWPATTANSTVVVPSLVVGGNTYRAASFQYNATSTFLPLLEREGVRAELAWLQQQLTLQPQNSRTIKSQMVHLSTTKRVLCSLTSLLVLETEHDYVQFGVDRNALSDIIEVTLNGVVLVSPSRPTFSAEGKDSQSDADVPDAEDMALQSSPTGAEASEASEGGAVVNGASQHAPIRLLFATIILLVLIRLGVCDEGHAKIDPPRLARSRHLCIYKICLLSVFLLHGCDQGGCSDGDDCYYDGSPQWLNIRTWAEHYLRKTRKPNDRDRKAATLYAEALAGLGRAKELQEFASGWLLWDPSNPQVYEHIGTTALSLSDTTLATRAFTSMADMASSNPEQLLRASWLCLRADSYDLAIELAQKAIEERADNPNAYRALGIARFLQGDMARALEAYAAAQWRSPPGSECSRGGIVNHDKRYVPNVMAQEFLYMEYHSSARSWYHFGGTDGCNIIDSILNLTHLSAKCGLRITTPQDCARAAAALGLSLNGNDISTRSCPSRGPATRRRRISQVQCLLHEDGMVKVTNQSMDVLHDNSRNFHRYGYSERHVFPGCRIYSCAEPHVREPRGRAAVVMSWLGDGNNVDLYLKSQGGGISRGTPDIREGLGPEFVQINNTAGRYKIGVFYSWAAAMGSARGVLLVWSKSNRKPTILPFALPPGENYVIEIAELYVSGESVTVTGGGLLFR